MPVYRKMLRTSYNKMLTSLSPCAVLQTELDAARREAEELKKGASIMEDRADAAEKALRDDLNAQHSAALQHVERQLTSLQQQLQHKDSAREQLLSDKGALERALEEAQERHKELETLVSAER